MRLVLQEIVMVLYLCVFHGDAYDLRSDMILCVCHGKVHVTWSNRA